ncbi:hypothetical protein ACIO14_15175 [Nocardia fluminea]|uniref:hypothetical protein n=1 Tax=Nocardia fluminea TaxID=134984 RepID=UPI00381A3C12
MQREHEEAMRDDFARLIDLEVSVTAAIAGNGTSEQQLYAWGDQRDELDRSWSNGPHRDQWKFLDRAYEQWRTDPTSMIERYADLAHNPNTEVDEVRRRSIAQAAAIAARIHPHALTAMEHAVTDRGHGPIERSR